jgi:hypothetical protein
MKLTIVTAKEGQLPGAHNQKREQAGENGISSRTWEAWSLCNVQIHRLGVERTKSDMRLAVKYYS